MLVKQCGRNGELEQKVVRRHSSGLLRRSFLREVIRLWVSLFSTDDLVALVAIRARFFCIRLRSAAASLSMATSRLRYCDRDSDACTTIPLGRCRIRTAESVVFRCCPPGPEARKNSNEISASLISTDKKHLFHLFWQAKGRRSVTTGSSWLVRTRFY